MIFILFAFIPSWSKEVRQGGLLEDRERLRDGHLRLLRVLDGLLVLLLLRRALLRRLEAVRSWAMEGSRVGVGSFCTPAPNLSFFPSNFAKYF